MTNACLYARLQWKSLLWCCLSTQKYFIVLSYFLKYASKCQEFNILIMEGLFKLNCFVTEFVLLWFITTAFCHWTSDLTVHSASGFDKSMTGCLLLSEITARLKQCFCFLGRFIFCFRITAISTYILFLKPRLDIYNSVNRPVKKC